MVISSMRARDYRLDSKRVDRVAATQLIRVIKQENEDQLWQLALTIYPKHLESEPRRW